MSSSSSSPKLPLWIFLVTDVVLLGTAAFIARQSARPLSENAMFAIVACIIAGATIGLVPLIVHFERQKNEMLDDRQRALEALARTVGQSAEQISIAAGGLHEMADLTQRNLKHAEQLPHKLQEKIAEFQVQLANANDAEREEMEKELEELRGAETDRLQSTFDKIAKTATDFAKLEAATQQHLTAANDALAKVSAGTAAAVSKAQATAEQALARASQDAARSLSEAAQQSAKTIEAAKSVAATELTALFDAQLARLAEANRQLASTVEALSAAATKTATQPAASESIAVTDTAVLAETAPAEAPALTTEPAQQPAEAAPSPKRPRKHRQEAPAQASDVGGVPSPRSSEPAPAEPSTAEQAATASSEPAAPDSSAAAEKPVSDVGGVPPPRSPEFAEPTPETSAPAPESLSVVGGVPSPRASEPSETAPAEVPSPVTETSAVAAGVSSPRSSAEAPAAVAATTTPPPAESPKPARKKRKADDDQPGLGLVLDGPSANGDDETPGVVERVLTSDGATRLIVTSYIGIGNRLFIRGSGPGLSWDKGVPLQFVSIGKWRWETSEASAAIDFKLLKNDEQECAALGKLTIEPGHQHEVTATFS